MKLWILAFLAVAAHADWPVGAEYRLEWQFKPATKYVRVPDYRQFEQLISKTFIVADENGQPTESSIRPGDDGKPELWFEAAAGRRYFTYWGRSLRPHTGLDEIPEIGSDAVVAMPGEMVQRPVWRFKDGTIEQTSNGKNVFLVSQAEFGDFEFRCRVRAVAQAGVAVRGQPEAPDSSGVYWLIGGNEDQLWGAVRDAEPGPYLQKEWNELKVTAQGRKLTFTLNGQLAKTVDLPEGVAERGVIALATYGGAAKFDSVRVGGDEVKEWRNADGAPCRGFVRLPASRGEMRLAFHKDPWSANAIAMPAGAWVWPAQFAPRPPFTVMIQGEGNAEYVSALNDAKPLRVLPASEPVEFQRANIYRVEEIPSDEELGRATLAAVEKMNFKGKPPVRFPTGCAMGREFDLRAGRALGFNALHGMPDPKLFDALGFKYIFGYTHLLTAQGKGVGYRQDINRAEMQELADRYRRKGLLDSVYMISVFDEPGFNMKADMQKGLPDMNADTNAWHQIITNAGLNPAEFHGYTAADREKNPLGVFQTMQVFQAIYPTRFCNARTAIREAFGTNVLVTANVHADHWFKGTLTDIEPWQIYSELEALDVPQACDYNVGWPQNEEYLIDTMRCALRPHDKPVNAYLAAQSNYQTRSPASLKLRAFSALGAGARSISFYEYGPRRFATENWYDTDREKLRVIGEINHAIGWAEDILLAGRPPKSQVAIMFSRTSDLWEVLDGSRDNAIERRQLFHLLRSLHQQPDAINETRDLTGYKVIFLAQKCVSKTLADRLKAWGGTVIASGDCGTCDELGRPAQHLTGKVIQMDRLGLAYHTGARMENDVLLGMDAAVRDKIAPFLPAPVCATDNPLIGSRLIESPAGNAIVLVNSSGKPATVRVKVSTAGFKDVASLEQGALKFTADGFELPVGLTDIVTLRP